MQENLLFAERFSRILKNKIYKFMTSVSKSAYIDKLDDIVNKYYNAHYSIIKTKPVNVKWSTYIDFDKCDFGDYVRISKYKNIFAKGYVLNWSEEVFVKKVKSTVP